MKTDKRGFLKGLMAAIWTPVAYKHVKASEPAPPVIKLKDYYEPYKGQNFCCSGIYTGNLPFTGNWIVSG